MSLRWFQRGALALVALFFLYAGATKIPDPWAFMDSVEAYRLVSGTPALLAALTLPFLEVAAAAALFLPKWRAAGAILITGMLLVFQVALAAALARGLDLDCGCIGGDGETSAALALVRNFGLLLLLLFAFFPKKTTS